MIADIPRKVELRFWNMAIPAMSKNARLQNFIRVSYDILTNKELRTRTIMILVGSLSGFFAGLVLFSLVLQ
jgi:hypothetical protein